MNRFAKIAKTLVAQRFSGKGQPLEDKKGFTLDEKTCHVELCLTAFSKTSDFVKNFRFPAASCNSVILKVLLKRSLDDDKSSVQSGKKAAFTLAETLITLTILGIIAAITVPSLINKYTESANRTKVKKAMAVYEKALNQMIIDYDINGNISTAFVDCSETTKYFKKIETIPDNDCRFKTADKVWWDITDIGHPVIMLNDKYKTIALENESPNLRELAKDTSNKEVFGMVGEIKNSIVRINDIGIEVGNSDNKKYLTKIYNYINGISEETSLGNAQDLPPCQNCIYKYYDEWGTYSEAKYTDGKMEYFAILNNNGEPTEKYEYEYDNGKVKTMKKYIMPERRLSWSEEYQYDGDLLTEVITNSGSRRELEYEDGKLVNQKFYTNNGVMNQKITYQYEDGIKDFVSEKYYDANNNFLTEVKYSYDSSGNITSTNSYDSHNTFIDSYSYTYYPTGSINTEQYETDGYGYLTEYTYDSSGNMIYKKTTEDDYYEEFTYEYGSYKNIIKYCSKKSSESEYTCKEIQ